MMVKVKAKTYTYDGNKTAEEEGEAWNVFANPKRGIVINFQDVVGTGDYTEIRLSAKKLLDLGFIEAPRA